MARRDGEDNLPACYALVHPGLEAVAADEIVRDLGGEVKKTSKGVVVFRVDSLDSRLLKLRTVEDVFLLGWGSDDLTRKAVDLKSIQTWTSKNVDWQKLLAIHHTIHARPKSKPTWRLVTQMDGLRGYRRTDAGEAMSRGLAGVFPASWKPAITNASVEIWLTIVEETAVCGMRLSDRTMRHRPWKTEHRAASLRPSIAAAMVRLAGASPGDIVLDPMCGTGTIPGEMIELSKSRKAGHIEIWCGDNDADAIMASEANLRRLGPTMLTRWDTTRLPLARASVDRIVCNPPFGKQMSSRDEIEALYKRLVFEWNRALKPGGRVVVIVSEPAVFRDAVKKSDWQAARQLKVEVLGQAASISVWQKPV